MSNRGDIEDQIVSMLESAIAGLSASRGPEPPGRIEGSARRATVYQTTAEATRLDWGQNEISETYVVKCYWHSQITRDTRMDEWEAFEAAILADPRLSDVVTGTIQAYVSSADWGEAHEGQLVLMTAEITVGRVE